MLCSEVQLFRQGFGYEDIKPLPCNRWTCDHCQPKRRRRLIAIAASGEPTICLTLTVNPSVGESPLDRRNGLHRAWRLLKLRILRQWALLPEKRWKLESATRSSRKEAILRAITAKTPQRGQDRLPYMAFLEATKAGEPHLHILLRCPYIPQDWISEQMRDLIGAGVCWIEKIGSTKRAIRYVTKYVTKAPAQFGATKRYWVSRDWEVNRGDLPERDDGPRLPASVRRVRWAETTARMQDPLRHVDAMADGWYRLWDRATPWERWGLRDPPLCEVEGPCRPVEVEEACPF